MNGRRFNCLVLYRRNVGKSTGGRDSRANFFLIFFAGNDIIIISMRISGRKVCIGCL